jgi:hypothetical protein
MAVTARLVVALLLVAGIGLSATYTAAQGRSVPRNRARPPGPHKSADGGTRGDAGPSPGTRGAAKDDAGAGEVLAQKTLDGGTKVFRFGELEIEGRLKNPQLVFFLRRVRAEFAAGDLGHRSFLRELGDTKHDPNF